MNRIWRRVCTAVNPVSTAVTRWWCHSALRRRLLGHGSASRQRRMDEQMDARVRASDELLNSGARDRVEPPGFYFPDGRDL